VVRGRGRADSSEQIAGNREKKITQSSLRALSAQRRVDGEEKKKEGEKREEEGGEAPFGFAQG
jgi:hypothetical protein